MVSTDQDIVDLCDYVRGRFVSRMTGLTDDELTWMPTADPRLGLRWRLEHIDDVLRDPKNAAYLHRSAPASLTEAAAPDRPASVMLSDLDRHFAAWIALVSEADGELSLPIGDAAGPFASATRRSFVLHIVDELIHHCAEAALLRDLYAGQAR